mmetsp:Transcript_60191/g.138076  ORF Transcript_60191/g.138076 Transcript_60191/m.138076 type:complete len:466 (+) Transcript_60191:11-1408(+)
MVLKRFFYIYIPFTSSSHLSLDVAHKLVLIRCRVAPALRRTHAAKAIVPLDWRRGGDVSPLVHVVQLNRDAVGRHREQRELLAVGVPRERPRVVLVACCLDPRYHVAQRTPPVGGHAKVEVIVLIPPAHVRGVGGGVRVVHRLLELRDRELAARIVRRPLHEVELHIIRRGRHVLKGEHQRPRAAAALEHGVHVAPEHARVVRRVARDVRAVVRDARRPRDWKATADVAEGRERALGSLPLAEEEARDVRVVRPLRRQERLLGRHELKDEEAARDLDQQAVVGPVVQSVAPLQRHRLRVVGKLDHEGIQIGDPKTRVEVKQRVVAADRRRRRELPRDMSLDGRDAQPSLGSRRRALNVRHTAVVRDGVQPEPQSLAPRLAVGAKLGVGSPQLCSTRLTAWAETLVEYARLLPAIQACRVVGYGNVLQEPRERARCIRDQVCGLADAGRVQLPEHGRQAGEERPSR